MKHPALLQYLPAPVSERLLRIASFADELGLHPYLVGGVVRDLLLSRPFHNDVDLTLTGGAIAPLARRIAEEWKVELTEHSPFMTFVARFEDGFLLDLVTARREKYLSPGALPTVSPGTLEDDLRRRDFAINAVAMSLSPHHRGELVDPHGGQKDLDERVVRVLHDKSFQDDPTRLFRAARYAARFDFHLEDRTRELAEEAVRLKALDTISRERVRVELEKILFEPRPLKAVRLLLDRGVLGQIDPGVKWSFGLFDDHGFGDGEQVVALILSLLLRDNGPEETLALLKLLKFPGSVFDRVAQSSSLYQAFKEGKPVTQLPRERLFPETEGFFATLSAWKVPGVSDWWGEYLKWSRSRPAVSGEDLKDLGFEPGPVYREILEKLAVERYKGAVRTREDEIRFVIDNFRRE